MSSGSDAGPPVAPLPPPSPNARSGGWAVAVAATLGMSVSYIDPPVVALVGLGLAVVPTSLAFALWPGMREE